MKKKLLLMCSVLITSLSFGQVIFSVESPASIGGSKDMTYAPTSTWTNTPDLTDPTNAVLGTLAFAKDASTADSLNCMQTVSNVSGKIAILYRGACEFGTKALNAEQAGAIAVVIINNQAGGPVGMGAGNDGPTVTIPVVMIGDLDGAAIVSEMENGPVDVFIGNKTGYYPNDLGLKAGNVVRAQHYATPQLLAQNDTEFDVQVGAYVYNFGSNDQANITLNATVTLNGTTLYDETSSAFSLNAEDSVFVSLPVFNEPTYAQGEYELVYTVESGVADDYTGDNVIGANFQITDRLISYATLDANGLPNNSGGF
ncbi:PA domain-containing protein, partial [Lishizhenia sp.]|uniref:PA domain-containing protein n=1 Tax=Lishizhenia sp. TaxID=2497594 RepID=UPI00299F1275